MVLNPPWEIWGPTYKLLNLISKIDSESSWKDSFPFDLFYFTDILSSCLWSYYTLFCSDLNLFSISTILPNVFVSFMAYFESNHDGAYKFFLNEYFCLLLFATL